MKKLFFAVFLLLIIDSCRSQSCNELPSHFSSYESAISIIKRSSFKFKDEANTSRSSWITAAKYYSCDGITGYFICTTNRNYEYVHKGVPLSIWKQFKGATSLGAFYNANIKHRLAFFKIDFYAIQYFRHKGTTANIALDLSKL